MNQYGVGNVGLWAKDGLARRWLSPNDVHVWVIVPDYQMDTLRTDSYEQILDDKERTRLTRFRLLKPRIEYLVTRVFVRTVLSHYIDKHPRDWCFKTNAYGRPEVDSPAQLPGVQFNLSHTDGLIACVISGGRPVGIDVENVENIVNIEEVAARMLTVHEQNLFKHSPEQKRLEMFLSYWTLKEAYVKARGLGFSIPLDTVEFDLAVPHGPKLRATSNEIDDWHFKQYQPTPEHMLAVAMKANPQEILNIQFIPAVIAERGTML